jgi:hypothetical protein
VDWDLETSIASIELFWKNRFGVYGELRTTLLQKKFGLNTTMMFQFLRRHWGKSHTLLGEAYIALLILLKRGLFGGLGMVLLLGYRRIDGFLCHLLSRYNPPYFDGSFSNY